MPSESLEPAELKATASGILPVLGVTEAATTGATLNARALIGTVAVSVRGAGKARLSVTVSEAEYRPGAAYV